MIFVDKKITEKEFIELLTSTRSKIDEKVAASGTPKASGEEFETFVYANMLEAAVGSDFEGHIEKTGAYAFPDIIAKKLYGVEVKMTIGDKWTSTGNSVRETTRIKDVKTIFIFFGKFKNGLETKFRRYEECLYDVGVTHSPRYKIDMELEMGDSIFDKMGIPYAVFIKEKDPITKVKDYYRGQLKEGEELWWLGSSAGSKLASPIIKSLKKLDEKEQERFMSEVFAYFPEVFGGSSLKFERAAVHLIVNYNAVSSNLRDTFTAGGRLKIKLRGKTKEVTHICGEFFSRAAEVKKIIEETQKERLAYYWKKKSVQDPIRDWERLVLKYSKGEEVDMVAVLRESFSDGKN